MPNNQESMLHFIRDINKNMDIMGLEIRRIVDEESGTPYWGIANTRNDDLAKIATFYSPEQVILFKFIVSLNNNFSIADLTVLFFIDRKIIRGQYWLRD